MQRYAQPSAWPRVLLALLALATLVGFFVYPTYPNYDSLYSLIWGRELLHGELPSFVVYRAPTEHPLALAFGGLLSLLGTGGDRLMVGATLASFVALAAGLYRLAAATFTPLIGVLAAALLCTRFDFAFLAARGYIDIPYLAFVVWAAALEAGERRRGTPVFVLLTLAVADASRGVAADRPVLALVGGAARRAVERAPEDGGADRHRPRDLGGHRRRRHR